MPKWNMAVNDIDLVSIAASSKRGKLVPTGRQFELLPGSRVLISRADLVSMELAARKSWDTGFRILVRAVFGEYELATHSTLGHRSWWPALDGHRLATLKGELKI